MFIVQVALVVVLGASSHSSAWTKANDKGLRLYGKGDMPKAAEAFKKALTLTAGNKDAEIESRKYLVLSLLGANQRDAAIDAYRRLLAVSPRFAWNPDEILPEEIAYLDAAMGKKVPRAADPAEKVPQQDPAVTTPPTVTTVERVQPENPPSGDAPRVVRVETKAPWRWYYLAPLGIGQFLARSPVRGAIFLTLQVAAVAMNVVGYLLYSRELLPDGTARSAAAAQMGQNLMNAGFFGIIGSSLAGVVDGIFFEP